MIEREPRFDKVYTSGTHRSRSPADTLDEYMRWSSAVGVTRLANVTGLDTIGIPVFVAIRPRSRSLVTAQGKGLDPLAAKVSAFMESVEAWHAEDVDAPLCYESFERLAERDPVIDAPKLPNALSFTPTEPISWIRGWDVMRSVACWVPFDCVTLNFVGPPAARRAFAPSSNGLASGNHLLEAILHGTCEVIERDALSLWELATPAYKRRRRIAPETVTDPGAMELLSRFRQAGVGCVIWDVTSDLEVPVYSCEIFELDQRADWRRLGIFGGYGCHLDAGVALSRALSEAAQSRLAFISGARDDLFRSKYERWNQVRDLEQRVALHRESAPSLAFGDRTSRATSTFHGDLSRLTDALREREVSSLVAVDLTKERLGIPVVKVVIPGLEARLFSTKYRFGARARQLAGSLAGGPE